MINLLGFLGFIFLAAYQDAVHHNETSFVHWMLWAILCGVGFLIVEKLNERNKR
jgi:hypothetical protein